MASKVTAFLSLGKDTYIINYYLYIRDYIKDL